MICSDAAIEKLKSAARDVKYNYEAVDDGYYYYLFNVYNLDSRIALVDISNPNKYYTSDPKTGNIEFLVYGADVKIIKKFEIRTIDKECYPDSLRDIKITLPQYNSLAGSSLCYKNNVLDECKKVVDKQVDITFAEMQNKSGVVIETKPVNKDYSIYYALGGTIVIIIVSYIIAYFIKMKKQKKMGI